MNQGAPVTDLGQPVAFGTQTLFSVFNDADPGNHTNNAGSTAPLKVEIRQTVWAKETAGADTTIVPSSYTGVSTRVTSAKVTALIVDPLVITGDEYLVEIREAPVIGRVWKLIDRTIGVTLLDNQTNFSGDDNYAVVHGLKVKVTGSGVGFKSFTFVANNSGPLDSAVSAAFGTVGFPTPDSSNPPANMQVNGQRWAMHTADNGGTDGGGTRGSYAAFISRVTRDGGNWPTIGKHDYEMRFTGSPSSPGINGCYAYEAFNDGNVFWVPF